MVDFTIVAEVQWLLKLTIIILGVNGPLNCSISDDIICEMYILNCDWTSFLHLLQALTFPANPRMACDWLVYLKACPQCPFWLVESCDWQLEWFITLIADVEGDFYMNSCCFQVNTPMPVKAGAVEQYKRAFARQRARDLAQHADTLLCKDKQIAALQQECRQLETRLGQGKVHKHTPAHLLTETIRHL